jgi:hypothetical protein
MRLRTILSLIVGIIVLIPVIFFSSTVISNITMYKIPLFGPDHSGPYPAPLDSYPANNTNIAADDPVRHTLISEDQAWGDTWPFLRDKMGFTIFLPIERRNYGLSHIVDDKGAEYDVWEFYVAQQEYRISSGFSYYDGGVIYIDAHDGHILWIDALL